MLVQFERERISEELTEIAVVAYSPRSGPTIDTRQGALCSACLCVVDIFAKTHVWHLMLQSTLWGMNTLSCWVIHPDALAGSRACAGSMILADVLALTAGVFAVYCMAVSGHLFTAVLVGMEPSRVPRDPRGSDVSWPYHMVNLRAIINFLGQMMLHCMDPQGAGTNCQCAYCGQNWISRAADANLKQKPQVDFSNVACAIVLSQCLRLLQKSLDCSPGPARHRTSLTRTQTC